MPKRVLLATTFTGPEVEAVLQIMRVYARTHNTGRIATNVYAKFLRMHSKWVAAGSVYPPTTFKTNEHVRAMARKRQAELRKRKLAQGEKLYWHCDCGNTEPAQPEYEHGDSEPCCLCEHGVARVVTLKEAAAWEQSRALGKEQTIQNENR